MTSHSCYDSLLGYQGGCQVPRPKLAQSQYTGYTGLEPVTLIRAERTAGELAVSGVYGESGGSLKTLPGSPETNSELPLPRGSFSISGVVRWLLPRVNSPRWDRPGPEKE
ncbi:hypothetical protein ES708_20190 [subsurface metagenome]